MSFVAIQPHSAYAKNSSSSTKIRHLGLSTTFFLNRFRLVGRALRQALHKKTFPAGGIFKFHITGQYAGDCYCMMHVPWIAFVTPFANDKHSLL